MISDEGRRRINEARINRNDVTKPSQEPRPVDLPESLERLRGQVNEQRERMADLDRQIAETPAAKWPQPTMKPKGAPANYPIDPSPSRNDLANEKAQLETDFDAQMDKELTGLGESHREAVRERINDYVSGKNKTEHEARKDASTDNLAQKQDSFADEINSYREARPGPDNKGNSPKLEDGPNDDPGEEPGERSNSDTPLTDQYIDRKLEPSEPSTDDAPSTNPASTPGDDWDLD